ncbi:MAG TPA: DUF6308 family protein [Anaeromyxobacteraceae bacterium]|nr:DUF6308 family protein [Anaeromyxobacteraceae bacterium]
MDPIALDVSIPERLDWTAGRPPWRIREGLAKLQDLYGAAGEGARGWAAYDAYAAARARHDPTWPYRLTGGDVGILSLVECTPTPAVLDVLLAPLERSHAGAGLSAIPTDWQLHDPVSDEQWARLDELYAIVEAPGLDVRTLTRLLCVKRPRLVPALAAPARPPRAAKKGALARAASASTRSFRDMLLHNRLAIAEIAARMNAWLPDHTPPDQRFRLTPARVLSELVWFDLGGWRRFHAWREKGGEVLRAGAGERRRKASG